MENEKNSYKERATAIQVITDSTLNAEWLINLSHELRSPLAAIQGYVTLLLRHHARITPEEQHEFLEAIADGSQRMASVLDSLLDVASLEMGSTPFRPLPFDLLLLVQDILASEQQKYPRSKISLIVQNEDASAFPDQQPLCTIIGDRLLVQKLLLQLLDNARKYTFSFPSVTVTVAFQELTQQVEHAPPHIRTYIQEHKQPCVQLSIRDEGIGLLSADYERIFERFERVDMQLTSPVSGLGLGLTLCKYIVALHHGAIWVESLHGEGSTFHILLPAA